MVRLPLLPAALVGVVFAACGGNDQSSATTRGNPPPSVRVLRDNPDAPAACRVEQAARHVTGFLDAFNLADRRQLRRALAPATEFMWYSMTESGRDGRRHIAARTSGEALRYFAERHRERERMHLIEFDVDYDRARNLGQFSLVVARRASDLRRLGIGSRIASGKGAINCESGRIVVWSMAMGPRSATGPCTRDRIASRRSSVVVACARGK